MAAVTRILEELETLPSLPGCAARVVNVLLRGDADLTEIEAVVRNDEGITTAVLRYANSSRYGRPGRVFSLKESIGRLGGKTLMKIALQQQMSAVFIDGGSTYGLRRGALWRGALAGAVAAEEVSTTHGFAEVELAFICALLRDIGKLVLDRYLSPEDIAIAGERIDPNASFLDAEREACGSDHAEIGAEIGRRWGLPDRITDSILHHHTPPAPTVPEHDTLFDIVHAADVICLWTGLATGHDGLQYPLALHVREQILGCRANAETHMAVMWNRLTEIESDLADACHEGTAS